MVDDRKHQLELDLADAESDVKRLREELEITQQHLRQLGKSPSPDAQLRYKEIDRQLPEDRYRVQNAERKVAQIRAEMKELAFQTEEPALEKDERRRWLDLMRGPLDRGRSGRGG